MTTSRLAILLAVVLAGLSSVMLLPKQLSSQPVGIKLALPEFIGEWYGTNQKITEKELITLGPETEFARKSYTNGRGDELQVSIVLSGQDMNTSIHRPERCLPAQGWTVVNKGSERVEVPDFGILPVTRLYNVRNVAKPDEPPLAVYNLNYYWFAGHTDVTASHLERTYMDIRDRVLKGYNQRWAYVTVSAVITKDLQRFGRSEKETDALIRDFIKRLVPVIHGETLKQNEVASASAHGALVADGS